MRDSSVRGVSTQVRFRADRLDAEIQRRFLTNEELGQMADLPEKTIRRWRRGEVQPRPRVFRRLARALDIEPGWFYE